MRNLKYSKKNMLNKEEIQVLNFIQGDLPLRSSPYKTLAKKLQVTEQKIIDIIISIKKRGYVRRFGALLSHEKAGLKANCMCVWNVPQARIEAVGKICSREAAISHCYERQRPRGWTYNFYTMIHAKTKTELKVIIQALSKKIRVDDFKTLNTIKKFKKTSPLYRV